MIKRVAILTKKVFPRDQGRYVMPDKIDYIAIGKRIRELRKRKGLTQEKLAKQNECSTSFLGHIERGRRIPSLETIAKIASLLDVSLEQLVYGLNATSSNPPPMTQKTRILNDIARILAKYIDEWLPDT
jgi:transcriptional regulator with XRE-family HTH domain